MKIIIALASLVWFASSAFGLVEGLNLKQLFDAPAVNNTPTNLDGFKVYKIVVESDEALAQFSKLGEELPVHYLRAGSLPGRAYDVAIAPKHAKAFEKSLDALDFGYERTIENLQILLEKRWPKSRCLVGAMNWTSYHSFDELSRWIKGLPLQHPFSVSTRIIGFSYEGRPIRAVKLSRRPFNKAIVIQSGIHAIEWISSAVGTCFLNRLLNAPIGSTLWRLSFTYDWIFIPIANPDGFVYTHKVHPLWRKNRKPTGFYNLSGMCYGTDLNRNYDSHWGVAGYNVKVPCDHWYGGGVAFSEPETRVLSNFLLSQPTAYVKMFLDLHSYGQLVLLPFGYTTDAFPQNYNQMMAISRGFAEAAEATHGTNFLYGTSGELLYPVSGSAKDWAYEKVGVPYTATIELRDRGTYGFFLPADQIQPSCEEFTDGMIGMLKAAEAEKLFA